VARSFCVKIKLPKEIPKIAKCLKLRYSIDFKKKKKDRLLRSPKFRHACEGRHPEIFEKTGFPPSRE
jgi:hypothetical protein